ncbi:MAG TPA: SCO family protein, partial [Anaerolineales bacterium]|nr:SCO family protein [Anaerolineales bacterium]
YEGTELTGEAPDFQLTDQHGSVIQLSDSRGKVIVLTFMDSKCTDTCPLTAFHFRQAYQQLNSDESGQVVFMGVNVNVEANQVADVYQITQAWRLDEIPTWHFLTGSPAELEQVWQNYGIAVQPSHDSQGEGILHTPGTYIIDPSGQKRWYISTPFSEGENTGFAVPLNELLVNHIREILKGS